MKANRLRHILIGLLLFPAILAAQHSDTLSCGYNHQITFGQIAAPALLTTTGTFISATQWLHNQIDGNIHTWTQLDGHARFEAENVLQYVPISSVLILKAAGLESKHGWRDLVNLGGGAALLNTARSIPASPLPDTPWPQAWGSCACTTTAIGPATCWQERVWASSAPR